MYKKWHFFQLLLFIITVIHGYWFMYFMHKSNFITRTYIHLYDCNITVVYVVFRKWEKYKKKIKKSSSHKCFVNSLFNVIITLGIVIFVIFPEISNTLCSRELTTYNTITTNSKYFYFQVFMTQACITITYIYIYTACLLHGFPFFQFPLKT